MIHKGYSVAFPSEMAKIQTHVSIVSTLLGLGHGSSSNAMMGHWRASHVLSCWGEGMTMLKNAVYNE
jgi:hypothetical protein